MFKKKNDYQETDINLWFALFTNPLIRRDTDQLKNKIKKSLRILKPVKWLSEELTSFIILSSNFSSATNNEIYSSITNEKDIQESEFQQFVFQKIDEIYDLYLLKLSNYYSDETRKSRELKEAITVLISPRFTTKFPAVPCEVPENFRGKPEIDNDHCVGCGACVNACPTEALTMTDDLDANPPLRKLTSRYDPCIFCGNCERICTTEKGI